MNLNFYASECMKCEIKGTNSLAAGALPETPLGELKTLPQTPSRLGGDRRLWRLHSRAFGTRLGASVLPYHLYVRGAASGWSAHDFLLTRWL